MIFLQVVPVVEQASLRLMDYGILGIMVIMLAYGVYSLFKNNQKGDLEEKMRLIKSNEDKTERNNILYTEMKEMQKDNFNSIREIMTQNNEITTKVVVALNKSTEVIDNNTTLIHKIIAKMI